MNVSNISHLFQINSQFANGKQVLKQPSQSVAASTEMLQQISDQIISKENSIPRAPINTHLIDTFSQKHASLEDMPDGELESTLELTKFFSRLASRQEKNLTDFKDRLQEMDNTIQGYQDILDGKLAFPEGMISLDAGRMLAKATQKREQFVEEGMEFLNKWAQWAVTDDGQLTFGFQLKTVLGENKFEGKSRSAWMIDPAADLYSEIDRVLKETSSVAGELEKGVQKIFNVLDSRGLGDKYKGYLDCSGPEESYFDQREAKHTQQIIRDTLRRGPLHEAEMAFVRK